MMQPKQQQKQLPFLLPQPDETKYPMTRDRCKKKTMKQKKQIAIQPTTTINHNKNETTRKQ